MHPLMNPTLARLHAEAYRAERLHDAQTYRMGQPSFVFGWIGSIAAGLEAFGRAVRRWSRAESTMEAAIPHRTPTAR